jgi:hypothetical protein
MKDLDRIRQAVAQGAQATVHSELENLLARHLKRLPGSCNLGGARLGFAVMPATQPRSRRPQTHPGLLVWRLPAGNAWEEPEDLPTCALSVVGRSGRDQRIHAEGVTLKGCGGSKVEVSWEERPEGQALAHVECAREDDPAGANDPRVRVTGVEHVVILRYHEGRFATWLSMPSRSTTTHVVDRWLEERSTEVSWIDPVAPALVGDVLLVKASTAELGSQQGCVADTRCHRVSADGQSLEPLPAALREKVRAHPSGRYRECGEHREGRTPKDC